MVIAMEEIRLEDDKVSQKSNSENGPVKITGRVKKKLLHFLTVMTIEPMMFVQAFGWQITSIAQSQMILYKTCRGKMLINNKYLAVNRDKPLELIALEIYGSL